jgi:hypothetical protein
MAGTSNRLSAVGVKGIDRVGMYHDGAGLYLQVSGRVAKSWIYRFMLNRRPARWALKARYAYSEANSAKCRRLE